MIRHSPATLMVFLLWSCTLGQGNAATEYCPFFVSTEMANDGLNGSVATPAKCPIGITTPGDTTHVTLHITDANGKADHGVPTVVRLYPNDNYFDRTYYREIDTGWFINSQFTYESDPATQWNVGLGGFTSPQHDSGDAQIITTRQTLPVADQGYALLTYQYVPQSTVNADKANVFVGDVVTLTLSINSHYYPNPTWKWYRDGTQLSVVPPTFTQQYTTPGTHAYGAVVTGSNGKSVTANKTITWQPTGHK